MGEAARILIESRRGSFLVSINKASPCFRGIVESIKTITHSDRKFDPSDQVWIINKRAKGRLLEIVRNWRLQHFIVDVKDAAKKELEQLETAEDREGCIAEGATLPKVYPTNTVCLAESDTKDILCDSWVGYPALRPADGIACAFCKHTSASVLHRGVLNPWELIALCRDCHLSQQSAAIKPASNTRGSTDNPANIENDHNESTANTKECCKTEAQEPSNNAARTPEQCAYLPGMFSDD